MPRRLGDEQLRSDLRSAGLRRVAGFSGDAAQPVHVEAYPVAYELGPA